MVSILAYGPRCPGFDFRIKIRCLLRLINSAAWRFRLESNPPRLGPIATLQNALHNANNYTWSFFANNSPGRGGMGCQLGIFWFLFTFSLSIAAPWTSRLLRPLHLERFGTILGSRMYSFGTFLWKNICEPNVL